MIAPTYSLCQRAIPSKTKSAMYSDELQNSGSTDLFLSNRTAVEHFILLVSQTIPLRLRFSSSREGRRCLRLFRWFLPQNLPLFFLLPVYFPCCVPHFLSAQPSSLVPQIPPSFPAPWQIQAVRADPPDCQPKTAQIILIYGPCQHVNFLYAFLCMFIHKTGNIRR